MSSNLFRLSSRITAVKPSVTLAVTARQVIRNGLDLLGLSAPEKM